MRQHARLNRGDGGFDARRRVLKGFKYSRHEKDEEYKVQLLAFLETLPDAEFDWVFDEFELEEEKFVKSEFWRKHRPGKRQSDY